MRFIVAASDPDFYHPETSSRPEAFTPLTLIRRHVSPWFPRDYHVPDAFRNYPRHVIRYALRAERDHDGFVLIIEMRRDTLE